MIELKVIEYRDKKYISFDQLDDILLGDSLRFTQERSTLIEDDPSIEIVGVSINIYIKDLRNRLIEAITRR